MVTTRQVMVVVGGIVAVLLQVFLAAHIAVLSAVPNFPVAFAAVMAVLYAREQGPIAPFVLGLAYDLVSGGPLGAMAFSLCAFSMAASWLFQRVNNDTLFMALVILAATVFLVEFAYGMFLLLFGHAAGFLGAFAFRIVPCSLYDFVIAAVLYALAARFLPQGDPLQAEISQLH